MNYNWDLIIEPGEQIKKEFTISTRYRNIVIALIVICAIIVAFVAWYVGLVLLLLGYLYWYYLTNAKHYVFTNKRVILVESFLGTNIISIDYNQITDIEIEQNVFDQFGGWGTLIINTAGTHVPEVNLTFIEGVQSIKQQLDQIRDTEKL